MEQENSAYIYVQSDSFQKCEPYLNKYFGISYGYFEEEISRMKCYMAHRPNIGESHTMLALETGEGVPLRNIILDDKFLPLFEIIKEEDDNDHYLIRTLWLVAYVIMEYDDRWVYELDDVIDYEDYGIVREDLLKLYKFMKSHNLTNSSGRKITIKHSMGNIDISNHDNWFTRKLLKDYLDKYLSDITSVEQAEQELLKYKKTAGRKIKDPRLHIIIYGIYRMFNQEKKMKSPKSDALCDFIISYLHFIGLIEDIFDLDKQWIRAQIDYLDKKDSPPLFPPKEVSVIVDIEELKNSGKRLY